MCCRCCVAANKILAQVPSFSLPLVLATPVTVALVASEYTRDVSMAAVESGKKYTLSQTTMLVFQGIRRTNSAVVYKP